MATPRSERALQDASSSLAALLEPEAMATMCCAGRHWAGPALAFNWADHCEAEFGAVCVQYLRFLELDEARLEAQTSGWRPLYLRLRGFHRQLESREPSKLGGQWMGAPSVNIQATSGILQGGHTVMFSGDDEQVSILPLTCTTSSNPPSFRPADFLDVVPISPGEVIGVAPSLELERWCFSGQEPHGAVCRCRVSSGLVSGDALEGLRLFVEHVAEMLFLFAGCDIHAFRLGSLQKVYTHVVPTDRPHDDTRCGDQEILARWDYGRIFLAHQAEGRQVTLWSTADGVGQGYLRSGIDGTWEFVIGISTVVLVVEVKLERSLLLAVSHTEDGASGTIHVWEMHLGQAESGPALQQHCWRHCDRAPDRVEARHGGRFVEAFFLPDSEAPVGIYDIEWFSPRLQPLFALERGVGDWRCDLRDVVARLEGSCLRWLPLWQPMKLRTVGGGGEKLSTLLRASTDSRAQESQMLPLLLVMTCPGC
ncbi:unnamed protein product [Effrenium voratum]|nr:unnamed protein product [Effrenium voratum]